MASFATDLLARGLRDDVAVARADDRRGRILAPRAGTLRRRRRKRPPAKSRFAICIKSCAASRRNRFSRRRCWALKSPRPIRALWESTYVQPEDGIISMADYAPHMKMVGFLHGLYPKVHISLHAGELAEGPGSARWALLPYSARGRGRSRGAHRPRRGRDARRPSLRIAERDGRETRDGGNQPHQQRRDSGRRGQGPSLAHLPQISRSRRAFDR